MMRARLKLARMTSDFSPRGITNVAGKTGQSPTDQLVAASYFQREKTAASIQLFYRAAIP
jgi:hypothetical protein